MIDKELRLFGRALIFLSVLLVLAVSANTALAQSRAVAAGDTVALVNGNPVTAADFEERFNLTIYPHKEDVSALQAEKERFLFSLIAEQLLADEGVKSGKFMTPEASRLEHEATQTFLRDALYRKEIMSKVDVSRQDVLGGIKRTMRKYAVDVYHFPDTSSAYSFYKECLSMRPARLDSFVTMIRVPHDTVNVMFGELMERQENAFWGKPVGFISTPVRGQNQFIVIRIIGSALNSSFAHLSTEEQEAKVRKDIRRRRETALAEDFMLRTLGDVKATVDHRLVGMLVDTLALVLKQQAPPTFYRYYNLSPHDVGELLRKFHAETDLPMISLRYSDRPGKDRTMSFGEVIRGLLPATFLCRDTTRAAVFSGLQFTLRHVIENELLAERAEEMGLQNTKEVRHDVNMIVRAYFATKMRDEITDTVELTRADMDAAIRDYKSSSLRNVRLTLQRFKTRTLDEAVDVFNRVRQLEAVSSSEARKAVRGLDVDTVTSDAYLIGEAGAFLSRFNPGQIYGPVKIGEGYTLYRLLSKKSGVPDTALAQAIDTARYIALKQKQDRVVNRYVASLAAKGDVKIFLDVLKRVNVVPIQMFTVRNIGFGGQINAVPGLPVCEDWTKLAPMREIIIP